MGFDKIVILPDETKELPAGFGPDHPTVKFFLLKKWLVQAEAPSSNPWQLTPEQEAAKAAADAEKAAAKAANDAAVKAAEDAAKAKAAEDAAKAAAQKKADADAKIASLARMNLEELRKEAAAAGVAYAEADTKAVIAQKITEKLQAEAR